MLAYLNSVSQFRSSPAATEVQTSGEIAADFEISAEAGRSLSRRIPEE